MRKSRLFLISVILFSSYCHAQTNTALDSSVYLKQAEKQFSTWFHIPLGLDVLDITKRLQYNFYSKLRTCTPDTYKYPIENFGWGLQDDNTIVPMYSLGVSVIKGMQDGKCVVDTSRTIENVVTSNHCEFYPASLAFFTDPVVDHFGGAAVIFTGKEHTTKIDGGDVPTLTTQQAIEEMKQLKIIMQNECTLK